MLLICIAGLESSKCEFNLCPTFVCGRRRSRVEVCMFNEHWSWNCLLLLIFFSNKQVNNGIRRLFSLMAFSICFIQGRTNSLLSNGFVENEFLRKSRKIFKEIRKFCLILVKGRRPQLNWIHSFDSNWFLI